jgi:hypothetical protein
MTAPVPGGTGRARSAEELLQVARWRGAQIRRRRRVAAGIVAACVASGVAAVLLTVLPGQAKQEIEVAGTPNGPGRQCPASAFFFSPLEPAPAAGLVAGPGLSRDRYAQLRAGQSTVLYERRGAYITLTRGVSPNAFAISLYAHGPRPLTPIEVLGASTYFYPPGSGLPQARIPFRYPLASNIDDACGRYQIVGSGVAEPALMATAERFEALPSPGAPTTVEGTAPSSSTTTPSLPPTSAPLSTTTTAVAPGPAANPVASPFDRCPSPAPLGFGQNATADAISTARSGGEDLHRYQHHRLPGHLRRPRRGRGVRSHPRRHVRAARREPHLRSAAELPRHGAERIAFAGPAVRQPLHPRMAGLVTLPLKRSSMPADRPPTPG